MSAGARRPQRARLELRLYVAGDSPNSSLARRNLQAILAEVSDGQVSVETVDVLRDPERGLRDGVLVTPTLLRVAPAPERRIVGNLRDRGAVVAGLGLEELERD